MGHERRILALGWIAVLTLGVGPALSQPDLAITEIDYDQPGMDKAEWIEIYNPFAIELQAAGLFLVFYNGDLEGRCQEYCRVDLSSLDVIPETSYLVFGAHPCARLPLCSNVDAIQNDAPTAVALVSPFGVVDAVEFGSDLVHSACGFDRTMARDRDTEPGSLSLCIESEFPYRASWHFSSAPTPCAANTCTVTTVPFVPAKWGAVKSLYR